MKTKMEKLNWDMTKKNQSLSFTLWLMAGIYRKKNPMKFLNVLKLARITQNLVPVHWD